MHDHYPAHQVSPPAGRAPYSPAQGPSLEKETTNRANFKEWQLPQQTPPQPVQMPRGPKETRDFVSVAKGDYPQWQVAPPDAPAPEGPQPHKPFYDQTTNRTAFTGAGDNSQGTKAAGVRTNIHPPPVAGSPLETLTSNRRDYSPHPLPDPTAPPPMQTPPKTKAFAGSSTSADAFRDPKVSPEAPRPYEPPGPTPPLDGLTVNRRDFPAKPLGPLDRPHPEDHLRFGKEFEVKQTSNAAAFGAKPLPQVCPLSLLPPPPLECASGKKHVRWNAATRQWV